MYQSALGITLFFCNESRKEIYFTFAEIKMSVARLLNEFSLITLLLLEVTMHLRFSKYAVAVDLVVFPQHHNDNILTLEKSCTVKIFNCCVPASEHDRSSTWLTNHYSVSCKLWTKVIGSSPTDSASKKSCDSGNTWRSRVTFPPEVAWCSRKLSSSTPICDRFLAEYLPVTMNDIVRFTVTWW